MKWMNGQISKVFVWRFKSIILTDDNSWRKYNNEKWTESYFPFSITVTKQTHRTFINVPNVPCWMFNHLLFIIFFLSFSFVVGPFRISNEYHYDVQSINLYTNADKKWDKWWEGGGDWWFKWMASISENGI